MQKQEKKGAKKMSVVTEKHKGITKSYVFPSKNQWTVCVYLKYWWLKILRRKSAVCDGVDDQKEIQESIDSSLNVIVLGKGEYNMTSGIKIGDNEK